MVALATHATHDFAAAALRLFAVLPFLVGCWAFRQYTRLELAASRVEGTRQTAACLDSNHIGAHT